MRIDIITIFPDFFQHFFEYSILKKAQEKGKAKIKIHKHFKGKNYCRGSDRTIPTPLDKVNDNKVHYHWNSKHRSFWKSIEEFKNLS